MRSRPLTRDPSMMGDKRISVRPALRPGFAPAAKNKRSAYL